LHLAARRQSRPQAGGAEEVMLEREGARVILAHTIPEAL